MNVNNSDVLDLVKILLEKPIMFNPVFKLITGHTGAALFLSQAWYYSNKASTRDGWFYRTSAEWMLETGLSRTEQDTARRILGPATDENPKGLGILQTKLRGLPAVLYYKIDMAALLDALQFAVNRQTQYLEYQQKRLQETRKLVSRKPANINESIINTLTNTVNTDVRVFSNWNETPSEFHPYFLVCEGQPVNLKFNTPNKIAKALTVFGEWILAEYTPADVTRAVTAIRAEGRIEISSPKSITWKLDAQASTAKSRQHTDSVAYSNADPVEEAYRRMESAQ
jgi:hypothetical protein